MDKTTPQLFADFISKQAELGHIKEISGQQDLQEIFDTPATKRRKLYNQNDVEKKLDTLKGEVASMDDPESKLQYMSHYHPTTHGGWGPSTLSSIVKNGEAHYFGHVGTESMNPLTPSKVSFKPFYHTMPLNRTFTANEIAKNIENTHNHIGPTDLNVLSDYLQKAHNQRFDQTGAFDPNRRDQINAPEPKAGMERFKRRAGALYANVSKAVRETP